ncbi:hypothetical protein JR338_12165 [Chloroflexota bacterium]|nr:hypothetical protein JR338_12165 [Chloroflexota bacterium]
MKKKVIPIILVISALFLFSCSPNDITSETEHNTTVMESSEAVMEANPSTEEPMPTEDDSAVMDATSNCYHPFFPISEGANWTYQLSTGESYTMTVTDVTEENFTLSQDFAESDLVLSVDWFCSDDGLLVGDFAQVDFLNQSSGEDGVEMTFNTFSWEGETLPAEDLFEVGYEWTATYQLQSDINMEGIVTTAQATVTINYIIAAIEEVTAPAGTFPEAYRVDSVGDISMTMDLNGSTFPMTSVNFGSSSWYVKGVGLIKTADDFTGYESGMKLIDSNLLN